MVYLVGAFTFAFLDLSKQTPIAPDIDVDVQPKLEYCIDRYQGKESELEAGEFPVEI